MALFACELQCPAHDVWGDPEMRLRLQFLNQWGDRCYATAPLRYDEEAEGTGDVQFKSHGSAPPIALVDHQNRTRDFRGKSNCCGLTDMQVPGELFYQRVVTCRSYAQAFCSRCGLPGADNLLTVVEFARNFWWYENLTERLEQEPQLLDLDQVADWGGIANRDHSADKVWTSASRSAAV